MPKEKVNEGLAAYVGISAPETPKYLLTNNFLAEYFRVPGKLIQEYSYKQFKDQGVLYTEDEKNEEMLKKSFDRFLFRYLGEETIIQENRKLKQNRSKSDHNKKELKHYYFPLTQEMLGESAQTLRHILYYLQKLDKENFKYGEMQKKLENYIFRDNTGLNHILKILLPSSDEKADYKIEPELPDSFWRMLTSAEKRRMQKLGQQLNEDLNVLLTHEYFLKLDFYRRYHYLSMLLTSYVIQYIVTRKGSSTGILCKGNPLDSRLDGLIHKACCNNYDDIRNLFPTLLKEYYIKAIGELADENGELQLHAENGKVMVNGGTFEEFITDVMGSKISGNGIAYEKLLIAFELSEKQMRKITVEEFVLAYISLTGTRRGSTLTKISSVLSTSGRQLEMVYPRSNARQKYFAMSAGLAEFYVRLYLAGQSRQYDYMDNFLEFLQERYRIVIGKIKGSERLIKSLKPRLSVKDFSENQAAFRDTLNGVNCLIKLSDSGYVITLPEEKGDFRLI